MSNATAAAYYQQYQQQAAQYQQQQQQMSGQQMHQKYKSTLCNVWLMEGVCARGRLCHYAHGIRELNYNQYYNFYGASTPTMGTMSGMNIIRQGQEEYNSRYYKTALCQFWQQRGNCNNGDQCRWAHGEAELRHMEQTNGENTAEQQQHVMIGPQLEGPLPTTTAGGNLEQQEQNGDQKPDIIAYEPARKRNRNEVVYDVQE